MRIPSQDERDPTPGTLQPRFQRILSFGDVLDEGVRLFRQHWVNFALISAVALIPPGLIQVWQSGAAAYSNPITVDQLRTGRFVQAASADSQVGSQIGLSILALVLSALSYCVWTAAVTATAETYLRGGEPSLQRVYRRALRRFFTVLLGTLMYALALTGLGAIGMLLFVLTVFGGLGGIIPGIGLLVWWLRPSARTGWLKWLIIVCTPFGLFIYFSTRWSMYIAAAVIERRGPLAALRRSSELIDRQVFRVLAMLGVTTAMVGVLVYTPVVIISVPLMITSGLLTPGNSLVAVITQSAAIVLRILFQCVGVIVYTVMFVDLRNRYEGTDLAERLTQLELAPVTPGG